MQDWPTDPLVFYIADDVEERDSSRVEELIAEMARDPGWSLDPPEFVDSTEHPPPGSNDQPIRTLGGVLHLRANHSGTRKLDPSLDLAHLRDVIRLSRYLCSFSAKHDRSIELQLGSTYAGSIAGGEQDRLLSEGLIGAWQEKLRKDGLDTTQGPRNE